MLGHFLRDVAKLNHHQSNFRIFGPDKTAQLVQEAITASHFQRAVVKIGG